MRSNIAPSHERYHQRPYGGSENPFELAADALEGSTRPRVPGIRVEANTEHMPRFEGVCQHEHLGFGIRRSPDCRARQPRVANLTDVRRAAAVRSVTRRPCPPFQVPAPARPND